MSEPMRVHVYAPESLETSVRVLPYRCQYFKGGKFDTWREAFGWGYANCPEGFRVFWQRTFEWHEPTNTELIRVRGDLTKLREESNG